MLGISTEQLKRMKVASDRTTVACRDTYAGSPTYNNEGITGGCDKCAGGKTKNYRNLYIEAMS